MFGQDKRDNLPRYCRQCPWLSVCHEECPKNRLVEAPDGEPGLNYLCAGYKTFFDHSDPHMRIMADLIHRGRSRRHSTWTECWKPCRMLPVPAPIRQDTERRGTKRWRHGKAQKV